MPDLSEIASCLGFANDTLPVGKELLVYATGNSTLGYKTADCSMHLSIGSAKQDLKYLGKGSPPSPVR
jgi:hypothetical protein